MSERVILVVDDEAAQRTVLAGFLRKRGMEAVAAADVTGESPPTRRAQNLAKPRPLFAPRSANRRRVGSTGSRKETARKKCAPISSELSNGIFRRLF